MAALAIDGDLAIPEAELSYATARSAGPGGQNVNKVETRVTLRFDLDGSPSLTAEQRQAIRESLSGRINRQGVLRVTSQRHRTQAANRAAARRRFAELLRDALATDPERRPTAVPARARERRLQEKRRRAQRKQQRAAPDWQE